MKKKNNKDENADKGKKKNTDKKPRKTSKKKPIVKTEKIDEAIVTSGKKMLLLDLFEEKSYKLIKDLFSELDDDSKIKSNALFTEIADRIAALVVHSEQTATDYAMKIDIIVKAAVYLCNAVLCKQEKIFKGENTSLFDAYHHSINAINDFYMDDRSTGNACVDAALEELVIPCYKCAEFSVNDLVGSNELSSFLSFIYTYEIENSFDIFFDNNVKKQ